jgi:hypothetical protein
MAAAAKGYQQATKDHGSGSADAVAAQAKIQEIADNLKKVMQEMDIDAEKTLATAAKVAQNYLTTISNAFDSGLEHWLSGHERFAKAMEQSFRQMADQFIMQLIRMNSQRLISDLINKESAEKQAIIDAKVAAVSAYKSTMAAIPAPFNLVAAPVAAAAAFTGAMAFASFDLGDVVPRTQTALIHGGERVLTEGQNKTFEKIANNGGGGDTHYHCNAAPGESPDSVSRNVAALQRAVRDGAFQ